MSSTPQHFADLTEADLREWRQDPRTLLLVDSLRSDRLGALSECAAASAEGSASKAAYQAGWADCFAQIEQHIMTSRAQIAQVEESVTTTDPAARRVRMSDGNR